MTRGLIGQIKSVGHQHHQPGMDHALEMLFQRGVAAVRLNLSRDGARIDGDSDSMDLASIDMPFGLSFVGCSLPRGLNVANSSFRQLVLVRRPDRKARRQSLVVGNATSIVTTISAGSVGDDWGEIVSIR